MMTVTHIVSFAITIRTVMVNLLYTFTKNKDAVCNITGSAQRLQKRNISQKVCEKYKIYRDGDKLRFYYHDESGIVKGALR